MREALLVIDMQKAYFTDDNLERQKDELIAAVQEQVDKFYRNKNLIINVKTIHSPNKETWTLNMLEDNQGFLFSGTDETKTLVGFPDNAVTIHKTRDSAFHETELKDILAKNGIIHLTLVGISAHTCIFHTAAAAYAYNIRVILLRKAIGDEDQDAMDRALNYLEKEYRQTIL